MKKVVFNSVPLVEIGKIKEAKGLKGFVKVHLFSGEAAWVDSVHSVFLMKKDSKEPREVNVESLKMENQNLVVKLKDINDRTSAEGLKGMTVLICEKYLISKKGENIYLKEILDFRVNANGKDLGRISGFDSNGPQDLILVGNIAIPLVSDFIRQIDYKNKTVALDLPPGLIELYDEV